MSKKRMIAGYNLQNSGVIAPGEPMRASVSLPKGAELLSIQIDPGGNFVAFADVWSHPEGTTVSFVEREFLIVPPMKELPPGNWALRFEVIAMPLIFFVFEKKGPSIVT
jgi:hypothetical protein